MMTGPNIYGADIYVPGSGGGQPGDFTLPGSGISVPAGLEAAFEFNGLLMNIQKNIDRYKITQIDGLSDADVRDTRDVNTDEDGETPFNSFYGGRTIVLTGEIQTYSVAKLRDMQEALKGAFADISNEYPLFFRTGDFVNDHFIRCKKTVPISMIEAQSNLRASRQFQITLRASNPRFLSYYQKSIVVTPAVPSTNIEIAVVTNAGKYWSEGTYRIYGPSASATLTNDQTGDFFTVNAIPSGRYYELNLDNNGEKTFKDDLGNDVWDHLDDSSHYVRFKSGDNHIFYTGDSPRVEMAWRDAWI